MIKLNDRFKQGIETALLSAGLTVISTDLKDKNKLIVVNGDDKKALEIASQYVEKVFTVEQISKAIKKLISDGILKESDLNE